MVGNAATILKTKVDENMHNFRTLEVIKIKLNWKLNYGCKICDVHIIFLYINNEVKKFLGTLN